MSKDSKLYNIMIWFVSILVPLVVALLLFIKWENDQLVFNMRMPNYDPIILLENLPIVKPLTFLPPIYATINGITALLLVFAVYFIKKGKRQIHENLIKVCIALSLSFLVMYIAYHITSDPTPFGGEGYLAFIYFFIFIIFIFSSFIVILLVLVSYLRASQSNLSSHRKIAKITFPVWWYVALPGVIVYLMICPYY